MAYSFPRSADMTGREQMPRRRWGGVPGSLIRGHEDDHMRSQARAIEGARRRREGLWIVVMGGRDSRRGGGTSSRVDEADAPSVPHVALAQNLPSPLAGEGHSMFQQRRRGEGRPRNSAVAK